MQFQTLIHALDNVWFIDLIDIFKQLKSRASCGIIFAPLSQVREHCYTIDSSFAPKDDPWSEDEQNSGIYIEPN